MLKIYIYNAIFKENLKCKQFKIIIIIIINAFVGRKWKIVGKGHVSNHEILETNIRDTIPPPPPPKPPPPQKKKMNLGGQNLNLLIAESAKSIRETEMMQWSSAVIVFDSGDISTALLLWGLFYDITALCNGHQNKNTIDLQF